MRTIGRTSTSGRAELYALTGIFAIALGSGLASGCGDDPATTTTTTTSSTTTSSSSAAASTTSGTGGGGTGGGGTGGEGTGGAGGGSAACTDVAIGATRGSAIAVTPDDTRVVAVNRDVGTVSVFTVDYGDGQPALKKLSEIDLGKASEPWQVAIDSCGRRAYVALRRDQKVVRIDNLDTLPAMGKSINVGSEPTGLALTPNNTKLYVANWVDGTLSVIDPEAMTILGTVDLNAALAATGLLGAGVAARAALAHPRAVAITNNGDASDDDEAVYVTEWFAQRTGPETVQTADTNKKGLVYKVGIVDNMVSTIDLPPVANAGFNDHNNAVTGCFPNQVSSITIEGTFAYVTSTCASPKGPIGVFSGGACTALNEPQACGQLGGVCSAPLNGTCNPNPTDVKTTTHPALTIIDLATGTPKTETLDKRFSDAMSGRMPHLPTDMGFINGQFGYISAMGADAVFKVDVMNGSITGVGSQTNKFINLRKPMNDTVIRSPIGIATAHGKLVGFVANDGTRDVTAISFNTQAIAGNSMDDFRIVESSPLPAPDSPEEKALKGKRFFNTGLGRWSLNGEAWGSCAACHIDGLSDNVTWYFARGPRQSVSLEGSFATADPNDQRIFNWTAIVDEIADFEGNTRGISGGKGAIVDAMDNRIDLAAETPPQQGLQGSSKDAADPMGMSAHPHSMLPDWLEIEAWVKTIRSPRKPTNLVQAEVDEGKKIFTDPQQGNCVGCHGGAKWTVSTLFYTPGDLPNAATMSAAMTSLSNQSWNVALNGFPSALFPVVAPPANLMTDARMRFGAPPGAEQIQCALRPVGTFGVSPMDVSVLELRQDMTTAGQGNADTGKGYNVPSLLGMQVGAPYFHAGNARTLEEVFDDALFKAHHSSAVAQVFTMDATKAKQLTAYVLSIDENEPIAPLPVKGAQGGSLCFYTP